MLGGVSFHSDIWLLAFSPYHFAKPTCFLQHFLYFIVISRFIRKTSISINISHINEIVGFVFKIYPFLNLNLYPRFLLQCYSSMSLLNLFIILFLVLDSQNATYVLSICVIGTICVFENIWVFGPYMYTHMVGVYTRLIILTM